MKKILSILALAFAVALVPVSQTGCSTPASARVSQVQSLKVVGHTAESAVAASAQFYASGQITAKQARDVIDLYNLRFQPAYRLAVIAVNSNLDSAASPDLINIATMLSTLVLSYQKP